MNDNNENKDIVEENKEESNNIDEKPVRKNVFRNKNFTLVFLGALVSNIASLFYSFAVSFYILKITGNNAFIQGLYLATGGIVFCVVTLFGGVIGDRFNKAKIMYICDYLKGITIIGFTLFLMFVIKSTTGQVVGLFVVAVISNAIAGIFSPASSAILPIIVEEDSYQQAQSYFSILNSFQSIVGIIIAGILYTLIPINVLFLIVGVCYIASAISEMFIKYDTSYEKRDEKLTFKIVLTDIWDGVKYLGTLKGVLALIIASLFLNFFFTPIFDNFAPYFVATDIAGSDYFFHETMAPEMWSSFFGVAVGLGSLVMGIVLSILPQKEKCNRMVRFAIVGLALTMISIAVSYFIFTKNTMLINPLLIIVLVALLLAGGLIIMVNVPSTVAMMKIVDKDKFGKVSSVISIGSQGLVPLATFLGGITIATLGSIGLLFICSGGLLLIAAIIFFLPSIREL